MVGRFKDAIINDICGERISNNIYLDGNGQLICSNCVLARTGSYDYRESELIPDGSPDKIVKVYRSPEEVFNTISMKSMNYKPLVDDHPEENVTPDTVSYLQKGFMTNIRRGMGEFDGCLMADIIATDPVVIDEILSKKKRDLSVGYTADIDEENGRYVMKNIRGNHIALCEAGRAGNARIRDSIDVGDAAIDAYVVRYDYVDEGDRHQGSPQELVVVKASSRSSAIDKAISYAKRKGNYPEGWGRSAFHIDKEIVFEEWRKQYPHSNYTILDDSIDVKDATPKFVVGDLVVWSSAFGPVDLKILKVFTREEAAKIDAHSVSMMGSSDFVYSVEALGVNSSHQAFLKEERALSKRMSDGAFSNHDKSGNKIVEILIHNGKKIAIYEKYGAFGYFENYDEQTGDSHRATAQGHGWDSPSQVKKHLGIKDGAFVFDFEAKGSFDTLADLCAYYPGASVESRGKEVIVRLQSGTKLLYTYLNGSDGKLLFIRRVTDSIRDGVEVLGDSHKLRVGQRVKYFGTPCMVTSIVPNIGSGEFLVEFGGGGQVCGRHSYDEVVTNINQGKIQLLDSVVFDSEAGEFKFESMDCDMSEDYSDSFKENYADCFSDAKEAYAVYFGGGTPYVCFANSESKARGWAERAEGDKSTRVVKLQRGSRDWDYLVGDPGSVPVADTAGEMKSFRVSVGDKKFDTRAHSAAEAMAKVRAAVKDAMPKNYVMYRPSTGRYLQNGSSILSGQIYEGALVRSAARFDKFPAEMLVGDLNRLMTKLGHKADWVTKEITEKDLGIGDSEILRYELIVLRNGETDSEFVEAGSKEEALSILSRKAKGRKLEFGVHQNGTYKILKSWK